MNQTENPILAEQQEIHDFQTQVLAAGVIEHSAAFRSGGRERKLFFRLEEQGGALADSKPVAEAFVLALLIPAMKRGQDLLVHARLDHDFQFNLNNQLIPFLAQYHRYLKKIRVESTVDAPALNDAPATGGHARLTLIGMSCGLDALTGFIDHERLPSGSRLKVNGLLFNDVGAFGRGREKFTHDLDIVRSFAARTGLPLFFVQSNMGDFYEEKYEHSYSLRNAAAAWALSAVAGTAIFASGVEFSDMGNFFQQQDSGFVEPITFPLMSSTPMQIRSTGFQHTRSEKYTIVINDGRFLDHLNTCLRSVDRKKGYINCGTCKKCSEILFRAEADGRLPELESAFNIGEYKRLRHLLIYRLAYNSSGKKPSANSRDTMRHLQDRGFKLPKIPFLLGYLAAKAGDLRKMLRPGR